MPAVMAGSENKPRILVVDDEPDLRRTLEILFRRAGFDVTSAPGCADAVEKLQSATIPFPVVVTDLAMPDGSGLDVLTAAKHRALSTEVLLVTAYSSVENAIDAMRAGAYDFVTKPFVPDELTTLVSKALEKHALATENERLRAQIKGPPNAVICNSPAMRQVLDVVSRIAETKTTVLITGESGTGKERIARELHDRSDRSDGPFLVVNCGALPEALMESELFGHERGAFTGAHQARPGLFREATGGTLLLDEVGELSLGLQVKLLRVLQEKKVRSVGSTREVDIDVRILAATNRDMESDVAAERFRQDLYYRLNVIRIRLPPLRERLEDIGRFAETFLRKFGEDMGKDVHGFTPDALRVLSVYEFPGNVRELENIVERGVALSRSSLIGLGDLPVEVSGFAGQASPSLATLPDAGCNLDEVVQEVERRLITDALARTGGVRTAAAGLLGVSFRSLRYRLQKLGLASPSGEDDEPGMPGGHGGGAAGGPESRG